MRICQGGPLTQLQNVAAGEVCVTIETLIREAADLHQKATDDRQYSAAIAAHFHVVWRRYKKGEPRILVSYLLQFRKRSKLKSRMLSASRSPRPRASLNSGRFAVSQQTLLVGTQSVSHCHKPRSLIAVGRVWDLWLLQ
jgi:hypothetical protein